MKPLQLPVTGDNIMAVERFRDDTRHMAEFLVLEECEWGKEGAYIRRFLSDDGYAVLLHSQNCGFVRIHKHANIIEGHILPDKPKKRRRGHK